MHYLREIDFLLKINW